MTVLSVVDWQSYPGMILTQWVRVTARPVTPSLCLPQVNIIPVIAKSDAITKTELAKFKIKISSELVSNGVQIYQFPTDDETVAEINSAMNVSREDVITWLRKPMLHPV